VVERLEDAVARYLVASEQMERSGPVAAAVRSAGYRSEEEESEGDGSSIEEDDDDEILEQHEGVTMHENHAPVYEQELVNATAGSSIAPPLEMGANGYPVDKKPHAEPSSSSANNHIATTTTTTTTGGSNQIELGNPTGIASSSAPIDEHHGKVGVSDATGAPANAEKTGPVADAHNVEHESDVASAKGSRFQEGESK